MPSNTSEHPSQSASFGIRADQELTLSELGQVIWSRKGAISIFTLLFSVLVVWYALIIPNEYKAKAVLAPAQEQSSGLASTLGQLGGWLRLPV